MRKTKRTIYMVTILYGTRQVDKLLISREVENANTLYP